MNIAVLLHGSGVYDGTEIHESVLTLLAIREAGHQYHCIAPNAKQFHVVNHLTGEAVDEERNVLVESARIARGEITDLAKADLNAFDALVMPGGFGTAKSFTQWAFNGPDGPIRDDIRNLVLHFLKSGKPIAALCMSPTTLAKAVEGTEYHPLLTVGTSAKESPYDIAAISRGMESIGSKVQMQHVGGIVTDAKLKIVTAPCYMMKADIVEVNRNIRQAIDAMLKLVDNG